MRSPTYALIWEQWRQVRTPIAFSLLLTAVASWTLRQIMQISLGPDRKWLVADSQDWGMASTVLAGICMILVMAALIFSHSSTRDLRMGLPQRLLTIPVATFRLSATQIIFRLLVVALVALAIGLSLTWIDAWYAQMTLPLVVFSILCYSYASLIATTLGKRNPVLAFVVIAFTMSPVIVSLAKFAHMFSPNDSILTAVSTSPIVVFGVFSGACLAFSVYRFATVRNAAPVQLIVVRSNSRASRKLKSNNDAEQYSFEWRRVAWLYPSFMVGITFFFVMPSFIDQRIQSFDQYLYFATVTCPPVAAFIVGMILIAREHRDSVMGISRFQWTRPLSVQQVVLRRMNAVARSILYTHIFIIALTLLAALVQGELASIRLGSAAFGLLTIAVVLTGVWCVVWVPLLPAAYFLVFVVYWSSLFINIERGWQEDFFLISLPVVFFWIGLVLLASFCYRRRVFEARIVTRFAVVSGILATILLAYFANALNLYPNWNSTWKPDQYVPMSLSLGALPLFSLLWQGFFLDRVRHNALFRRLPARDS